MAPTLGYDLSQHTWLNHPIAIRRSAQYGGGGRVGSGADNIVTAPAYVPTPTNTPPTSTDISIYIGNDAISWLGNGMFHAYDWLEKICANYIFPELRWAFILLCLGSILLVACGFHPPLEQPATAKTPDPGQETTDSNDPGSRNEVAAEEKPSSGEAPKAVEPPLNGWQALLMIWPFCLHVALLCVIEGMPPGLEMRQASFATKGAETVAIIFCLWLAALPLALAFRFVRSLRRKPDTDNAAPSAMPESGSSRLR